MLKKIFIICLLFSPLITVSAQTNLTEIILDGWYTGTLDNVLERISREKNLKFSYNKEYASKVKIDAPPFKRDLDNFLKYVVCHKNKLKYYIDDADVIHVVEVWKQVEEEKITRKNVSSNTVSRRNLTLSGKIIDKENSESLPFVNLFVNSTRRGSSSNGDGYFTLIDIPSDTSTITVTYIGYKPFILKLTPETDISNYIIELEQSTELLNEVIILSDKQDLLQTNDKPGLIKMTPLKMNLLPSLGEKDIFRTFQLMPGISAANENSSGLYVRGGTPDQSLVLYDGITIYNVEHLFGFFSAFNSNAIKDIQLYKGGFDAKHGGRLSSVVEITGRDGSPNKFGAMADISLMSANLYMELPLGNKITFLAAGRRSWQSPFYNAIYNKTTGSKTSQVGDKPDGMGMPDGDNKTNFKSYFYDLNAKLTYKPTSRDIISVSFYNGKDDLDNSFQPEFAYGSKYISIDNVDKTEWGNTGVAGKWSHNWSRKLYSNLLISYSNYFNDRDRVSTTPGTYLSDSEVTDMTKENNQLDDYSAKLDFEYALTSTQKLSFGAHYTRTNTSYQLESDSVTILDTKNDASISTLYISDRLMFAGNKFEVNLGLRGSHYSPNNKVYFEPRANASYKIDNQWKLKGTAGYYYQFAKKITREDVMQGNRDFWLMADGIQMPVGKSVQGSLGISYETKDYLFDVEAYYKKLDNITEYSIRTVNMVSTPSEGGRPGNNVQNNSQIYSNRFYTGNGHAKGIDFLIQKKYGDFTGWVGYTIGEVIHNFPDLSSVKYYASNDVRHELKIVGIYKWRNWDFSANWIFASGKPYTAPEGIYQITLPDNSVKTYITPSAKNGQRLPAYHRLDVAATYSFKIKEKYSSSVNISLFNLYNRSNVWYKEFQVVDDNIVTTNVNYLGIMPNINYTIKF